MANSAAILSLPESLFDVVRPGIMLYGVSPFNDNYFTLKPVMQLSAPIISIKTLQAGDCVGYGASWTADKQTTIAIIAIGDKIAAEFAIERLFLLSVIVLNVSSCA
jgi:alanine racemase